ncbi:unnamed protein product [Lymnaea stagnalis]|uniref:THD domain-containing protein n=1 Tax=Lymnaea stagnalis TaxID=6523 RepID=A0AAV2I0M0_LYMST
MIGTIERDREFPGEHVFLGFDVNNTPNEHTNGVDVTPSSMRIIHSGMYYLYSSIKFTLRKQSSEPSSFSTSVHLWRPGSPADNGELLKSTHTGGRQIQETVFTGGVFHLQAGDLLQVCVSGRDIVNFKSDSTYTGLILLADPVAATSTVKK